MNQHILRSTLHEISHYMETKEYRHRGFCGIGIYGSKFSENAGTLWRSSLILGADFTFVIGKRYKEMPSDTCKCWRHIPMFEFKAFEDFLCSLPKGASLIGVELDPRSISVTTYKHPERAVYLLGAEDSGLPQDILGRCDDIIQIPASISLNVAVAGSIVLYDRNVKSRANV